MKSYRESSTEARGISNKGMFIYQKTSKELSFNLCEQCKTKEANGNCQCVEAKKHAECLH
jgi:hypothetical protein